MLSIFILFDVTLGMKFNAMQHKHQLTFYRFLTHFLNIKGKPPISLAPI
jgi:hypothetical protein